MSVRALHLKLLEKHFFAKSEKPGAVHIDIPENIAAMPAFGHPLKRDGQEKTYASYRSLDAAAMAISKAKNPLILVRNGTIRAQASEALTEFANTFMGKGQFLIPTPEPYGLWGYSNGT